MLENLVPKAFLGDAKAFLEDGFIKTGPIFDPIKCEELYQQALAYINVDDLFRSQQDWEAEPFVRKTKENPRGGANPGKGVANLLERCDTSFIEENETFVQYIENILGKDYEILLKKFVCGVPYHWVPDWLSAQMTKTYFDNLNAFLKLRYRDITYFRGIDYHMDIMDRVNERPDIITIYVYLQDVDDTMSPLHVVKKSHRYCRTLFPHYRREDNRSTVIMGVDENNCEALDKEVLTGKAGSMYIWSSLTMHATQPTKTDRDPRISLRYTIKKNSELSSYRLIDKFLDDNNVADYRNIKNNSTIILQEKGKHQFDHAPLSPVA